MLGTDLASTAKPLSDGYNALLACCIQSFWPAENAMEKMLQMEIVNCTLTGSLQKSNQNQHDSHVASSGFGSDMKMDRLLSLHVIKSLSLTT